MPAQIQRLLLWDVGRPTLKDLADLSPEQLRTISEFIDENGFDPVLTKTLILAGQIELSHEKTLDLLRYTQFLDDQRKQLELTSDDIIAEFGTYAENKKSAELKTRLPIIEAALKELFRDRPGLRMRAKVRSVTTGIVPVAIDFHSLCDLRPIFNEERTAVVEWVPVTLVRVRVHKDTGDEEDLVFQIDANGVKEMEALLARLRKKLDVIEHSRHKLQEVDT
jgi:hypothetical protein